MTVNKVILVGNLGADPELKQTGNNKSVCNLRIATNERRKDSSGTWSDHTEWHNVVLFGKNAETSAQYLQKGRQVFIEGRIQTRKWQDKDGRDRFSTEIVANSVQFLGSGGVKSIPKPETSKTELPDTSDISFDDDEIVF